MDRITVEALIRELTGGTHPKEGDSLVFTRNGWIFTHNSDLAETGDIETHNLDTTDVHGIEDTSFLETVAGAQDKVDVVVAALNDHIDDPDPYPQYVTETEADIDYAILSDALVDHNSDTTSVHGITDTSQIALKNAANVFDQAQVVDRATPTSNVLIFREAGADKYAMTAAGRFNWRFVAGSPFTSAMGEIASGEIGMILGSYWRVVALKVGATEVISSARVISACTFGGSMKGAAIADADGTLADITAKFNTLLAQRRTRGDQA